MNKAFTFGNTRITVAPLRFGLDPWRDAVVQARNAIVPGIPALRIQFSSTQDAQKPCRDLFAQGIASQGAAMQVISGFYDGILYALREEMRHAGRMEEKPQQFRGTLAAGKSSDLETCLTMAYDRLSHGLFSDALEYFQKAGELSNDNLDVPLQLGFLYLFGADAQDSFINLEEAERFLSVAQKYADAYPERVEPELTDLVIRHLAICLYARASEARRRQSLAEAETKLREADALLTKHRQQLSFIMLHFAARVAALCGDGKRAASIIGDLCDSQWFLLRDSVEDEEFAAVRGELELIRARAKSNPGPLTRRTLDMAAKTRRGIDAADANDDRNQMLKDRKQLRESLTAVEKAIDAMDGTAESAQFRLGAILRDARTVNAHLAGLHVSSSRERLDQLQMELKNVEGVIAQHNVRWSTYIRGPWITLFSVTLAVAVLFGAFRVSKMEFGESIVKRLWPASIPLLIGAGVGSYMAKNEQRKRQSAIAGYTNRSRQLGPMIAAETLAYERWLKLQNETAAQNWEPDTVEVVHSGASAPSLQR